MKFLRKLYYLSTLLQEKTHYYKNKTKGIYAIFDMIRLILIDAMIFKLIEYN